MGAQTVVKWQSVPQLPGAVQDLVGMDSSLRKDVVATEGVVDLVEAWVSDSVMDNNRQYLSGGWGKIGKRLNRYWQYMTPVKQKYVATISREYKIYDGLGEEVDMNIFVMPHLPEYISMVRKGFNRSFEQGRSEKHYRYDNPPYPCPEELRFQELGFLTVECEGTLHADYRDALSELFIPTAEGKHHLEDHGNFGVVYPTFGLYGAWVMDCNHNCRPEIHPIDWMWWLDLSEDRPGSPRAKSWIIGLVRDGSERFDTWSPAPLAGEIAIPVALPPDAQRVTITVEPLVHSPLDAAALAEKLNPSNYAENPTGFRLEGAGRDAVEIEIKRDGMPDTGWGMALEGFVRDESTGFLMGQLRFGVATPELFTGRVTVDFE